MRIGGPRSLFSDPAILALLALHAGKDAADVYKAYDAKHSQDLLAKAYLTGAPVMSEPGGPFRQLASKLTGGYINPDRMASGSDLMNQSIMLSNLNNAKLGALEHAAGARKVLGPGPFEQGGPFSAMLQRSGVNTDLSGPLPSEIHQQRQDEAAAERAKNQSPEAKKQSAIDILKTKGPIELQQAVEKRKAEGEVDLGLKPRIAGAEEAARLGVSSSPLGLAAAGAKGAATAEGAATGRVRALENTKIGDIKDQVFYDPKDFRNITNKSPELTWKQAHDMHLLPVKAGSPQEANVKNAIDMHNAADRMRPLINKVLPIAVSFGSSRTKGITHYLEGSSNDDLTQLNSYRDKLLQLVKLVTGRVSVPEVQLGNDYFPKTGTPLFGHGPTQVDTRKEANDKLDKILRTVDNAVRGGVYEGINNDRDSDLRKAIDGAAGE